MLLHGFPCVLLMITSITWAVGKISYTTQKQSIPRYSRAICRTTPGLSKSQRATCMKQPDATKEALEGVKLAIRECQFQFQGHRWNCSSLAKKTGNPYTSSIFNKGYKETAFAYAISSAGVVIAVANACSRGKLMNCDIIARQNGPPWKWGGCCHNIEYGIRFSKKFLDNQEDANDMHSKFNLHNIKVGRLMVAENTKLKCKCHGVSGSCELKSCFKIAPSIRIIGDQLKLKMDGAIRINPTNLGNSNRRKSTRMKKKDRKSRGKITGITFNGLKKRDIRHSLVYYEPSPTFCDKDTNQDIAGTSGRRCNVTDSGADSCSTLCCGRGYDKAIRKRIDQQCTFVWCCKVDCVNSTVNEEVTICK